MRSLLGRSQLSHILSQLNKKMVILSGPRQVGKTSMAKEIAKNFRRPQYYNYDNPDHRNIINELSWPNDCDLIIFDEIHKRKEFKTYLKGVYDTKPGHQSILVTGSARLDFLKKMGDSMLGRYYSNQILPFSLKELADNDSGIAFESFWERGGFPEPLLSQNEAEFKLWRKNYYDNIIRIDLFEFVQIGDFRIMPLLIDALKERVGSPISYSALAYDLNTSVPTIKKYIEILEALYLVFRVTPFSTNITKAIVKEPKLYFYDFSLIKEEGLRLENLVAVSLLKHANYLNDTKGTNIEIKYLRTKNKQEIDFAICEDGKIIEILEVKLSDKNLSTNLVYFSQKYNLPAQQLVLNLQTNRQISPLIRITQAKEYLLNLAI